MIVGGGGRVGDVDRHVLQRSGAVGDGRHVLQGRYKYLGRRGYRDAGQALGLEGDPRLSARAGQDLVGDARRNLVVTRGGLPQQRGAYDFVGDHQGRVRLDGARRAILQDLGVEVDLAHLLSLTVQGRHGNMELVRLVTRVCVDELSRRLEAERVELEDGDGHVQYIYI